MDLQERALPAMPLAPVATNLRSAMRGQSGSKSIASMGRSCKVIPPWVLVAKAPQGHWVNALPYERARLAVFSCWISSRMRAASSNSRSRACWYICCSSTFIRAATWAGL